MVRGEAGLLLFIISFLVTVDFKFFLHNYFSKNRNLVLKCSCVYYLKAAFVPPLLLEKFGQANMLIPVLQITRCVTLGKLLSLSEPPLCHL